MQTIILALAFLSVTNPVLSVGEEYVDMIELAHFYDTKGQHVFDQGRGDWHRSCAVVRLRQEDPPQASKPDVPRKLVAD